jgi:hypothetical protein
MPINSVQTFVKTQLNGLAFPSGVTITGEDQTVTIPNLIAYIAPPVPGTVELDTQPLCFIWGAHLVEDRKEMNGTNTATIGTTAGFRVLTYDCNIWIKYILPNTQPLEDNIFPLVVDSIMQKLRGIVYPVSITDAITGWPSRIQLIGEHFDVTYGDVRETADQQLWLYEAQIIMTIKERIQQ